MQKSRANDIVLPVWEALARGIQGDTSGALASLNQLSCRKDLILMFWVAQLCVHRTASEPDEGEIRALLWNIRRDIKMSNVFSCSLSVQVAWMFDDRVLTDELLKGTDAEDVALLPIVGWIHLTRGNHEDSQKAFAKAAEGHGQGGNILALYGTAVLYTEMQRMNEAMEVYAMVLNGYDFPEIYLERARLCAMQKKWGAAAEVSMRVADQLPTRLEVELVNAIAGLVHRNDAQSATMSVAVVADIICEHESKNWRLCVRVASALGTLSCGHLPVIDKLLKISQAAVNMRPYDAQSLAIHGYHQRLARNYVTAFDLTLEALNRDPENMFAIANDMKLLMATGRLGEVTDQLDLYGAMVERSLALVIMTANIARTKGDYDSYIMELLVCLERHVMTMTTLYRQQVPVGDLELPAERHMDMFIAMNVHDVVAALDELVVYNGSLRFAPTGAIGKRIGWIFTTLDGILPGHGPIMFAKAWFYERNKRNDDAMNILLFLYLSRWDYRIAQRLSLTAAIYCRAGDKEQASEYLSEAAAIDGDILNDTLFQKTKARIEWKSSSTRMFFDNFMTRTDASIVDVLGFIDICIENKGYSTAFSLLKIVQKREMLAEEKSEFVARQGHIYAGMGQLDKGLGLLERLKKRAKYGELALRTEAEIRFSVLNDKAGFLGSLKELVGEVSDANRLTIIGDAYCRVLDFENAAEWYAKALEQIDSDNLTLKKYVLALTSAHDFDKAVEIFTNSAKSIEGNCSIPLNLISELVRLRRFRDAQQCIKQTSKMMRKCNEVQSLEFMELRGIVAEELKDIEEAEQWFDSAIETYSILLSGELVPTFAKTLKYRASRICIYLGKIRHARDDEDGAVEFYESALEYDEHNCEAVLALVRFHKKRLNVQQCITLCSDYLSVHPNNEKIALLLTSFETKGYKDSIGCLESVLKAHPSFYRTLVRLIEICTRAGQIALVRNRITKEKSAGMTFARSLFNMYTGLCVDALAGFRMIECDSRWGDAAKRCIFQLLVNPGRNYIWSEKGPLSSDIDFQKAIHLIESMGAKGTDRELLIGEIESARNTESSVSDAMHRFERVAQQQTGNVAALVGMARCMIRLGERMRADKIIDRVLQGKAFHETYSYFEEAYLMRAHITLNDENYRAAQTFIFSALNLNMSSARGWFMAAQAHQRNHMFSEAAGAYLRCWELSGRSDLDMAYQFAECQLRANRPESALSMCRLIQESNPNFKDLHDMIVAPGYQNLRP